MFLLRKQSQNQLENGSSTQDAKVNFFDLLSEFAAMCTILRNSISDIEKSQIKIAGDFECTTSSLHGILEMMMGKILCVYVNNIFTECCFL